MSLRKIMVGFLVGVMLLAGTAVPAAADSYVGDDVTITANIAPGNKFSLTSSGVMFSNTSDEQVMPGDMMITTVHIQNNSAANTVVFLQKVTVDKVSKGSESLAASIHTVITSDGRNLFNGNGLGEATTSTRISIPTGESKDVVIQCSIPSSLGNDAQGAYMQTTWYFAAETDGQTSETDTPVQEPNNTSSLAMVKSPSIPTGRNNNLLLNVTGVAVCSSFAAFLWKDGTDEKKTK